MQGDRPLIQFRIERDHASIGLLQLAVELGEFLLMPAQLDVGRFQHAIQLGRLGLLLPQLVERLEQLSILPADLVKGILKRMARQFVGDPGDVPDYDRGRPLGEGLPEGHDRAPARRRFYLESIHHPTRPEETQAEPGGRPRTSLEDFFQILDPGTLVKNTDEENLGRSQLHPIFDPPAARILDGIANDLGDGRGDARLILGIEAQETGDLTSPLAGLDDILLLADIGGDQIRHLPPPPLPSRTATTVTSSRPRLKSR